MDLLDYLRLLRRRWRILVACALVAGVAAWVTTPANPTNNDVTYVATHQLIRDSSAFAPQSLATVALFVKTGDVPKRVAERLGYTGEPAVLASKVTLEPNEQVGTLDITVEGHSPEEAAARANAFAEETLALLGEQATQSQQEQISRVNEQLTTLQAEIDDLNKQITQQAVDGQAPGTLQAERDSKLRQYGAALDQQQQILNQPPPSAGYVTLQEALPELASVEGGGFAAPRTRPARTAIAVAIGLLLGLAAVLLVERLDTRLHDVDEIADAFELPVIAEVPREARAKRGRILTETDPMSAAAEAYRTLRAALLLAPVAMQGSRRTHQEEHGEPQVILVTSGAPGDGKTTTVANLAATMAETGRSVLVLGCDFRRPEIHDYFDCPAGPGIAEILTDRHAAALDEVVQTTNIQGVRLAASGNQLRSFGDVAAAGRRLVAEARTLADVVIIDTPPLLATNDASELIPACDAVVVVSRIDKTTGDAAKRVRTLLGRLGAPVSGVVAIGVPETSSSYSSYYVSSSKDDDRRIEEPPTPVVRPTDVGGDVEETDVETAADEAFGDEALGERPLRRRRRAANDDLTWRERSARLRADEADEVRTSPVPLPPVPDPDDDLSGVIAARQDAPRRDAPERDDPESPPRS